MISALKWIDTDCTDPYGNLATEKLLTLDVREGECILFLWQNQRTVVIGRNQNAWEECSVWQLEKDGGHLARRLSGGGAVYHDLGNLNFSFAVRKPDYDLEKQSRVILRAAEKAGVTAERTGRNDLETGGRKFSGNAYFETRGCCCHHGTIMLDVDMDAMTGYLTVSGTKLQSKGVASVRSRVVNLKEICRDITVDRLKTAIIGAFGEVYGLPVCKLERNRLRETDIVRESTALSSEAWLFPPRIPFTAALENRYEWGSIRLEMLVRGNRVVQTDCVSDAMDESLIRSVRDALRDCPYSGAELAERAAGATLSEEAAVTGRELRIQTAQDIAELLRTRIV